MAKHLDSFFVIGYVKKMTVRVYQSVSQKERHKIDVWF